MAPYSLLTFITLDNLLGINDVRTVSLNLNPYLTGFIYFILCSSVVIQILETDSTSVKFELKYKLRSFI